MKARVIGAQSCMEKFSFHFSCLLGEQVLRQTANLSKSLQSPDISAVEGQEMAANVLDALKSKRSDDQFEELWNQALASKPEDVGAPTLPRKSRITGATNQHFPETPKDKFRQIYLEVYDNVISSINQRVEQPDYKVYTNMQNIIIKSFHGVDCGLEFDSIAEMYGDELDIYAMRTQSKLLPGLAASQGIDPSKIGFKESLNVMRNLSKPSRIIISEVYKLAKLIVVAPATNATSERSFSSMKRIKTYLRATMTDNRINHIMVLHVHKDKKLDIDAAMAEFISRNDRRKLIFMNI